jgi:hypothetical protein
LMVPGLVLAWGGGNVLCISTEWLA